MLYVAVIAVLFIMLGQMCGGCTPVGPKGIVVNSPIQIQLKEPLKIKFDQRMCVQFYSGGNREATQSLGSIYPCKMDHRLGKYVPTI